MLSFFFCSLDSKETRHHSRAVCFNIDCREVTTDEAWPTASSRLATICSSNPRVFCTCYIGARLK